MNKPLIEYVGGCSYGALHPDHGITDIRLRIDPSVQLEVELRIMEFVRNLDQELRNVP